MCGRPVRRAPTPAISSWRKPVSGRHALGDASRELVPPFDPQEHRNHYPDCDIELADINGDGSINALDIEPSVVRFLAECSLPASDWRLLVT